MHLTDEQLNEYVDNESIDRVAIQQHLASCADCAARLSALQALFAEIESLPEVEFSQPLAARISLSPGLPVSLPRALTLTAALQAVLVLVAMVVAAPFVMEVVTPFASRLPAPSLVDLFLALQSQWMIWLDMLSTFQLPSIPELPIADLSNLITLSVVIGISLIWLIGNGLLLRNQIK